MWVTATHFISVQHLCSIFSSVLPPPMSVFAHCLHRDFTHWLLCQPLLTLPACFHRTLLIACMILTYIQTTPALHPLKSVPGLPPRSTSLSPRPTSSSAVLVSVAHLVAVWGSSHLGTRCKKDGTCMTGRGRRMRQVQRQGYREKGTTSACVCLHVC